MNKKARIAALEGKISALRSKVALQQVSHYFQLVLHSYRPGQKTLTVAILANAPGPDTGLFYNKAADDLLEKGHAIYFMRTKIHLGLVKSMKSKPELWGLQTEGGHSKFKAQENLGDSEPRYFPKANRITHSAYLELVFTNPEDFDLETFKTMLKTVAKLFGTKVKV